MDRCRPTAWPPQIPSPTPSPKTPPPRNFLCGAGAPARVCTFLCGADTPVRVWTILLPLLRFSSPGPLGILFGLGPQRRDICYRHQVPNHRTRTHHTRTHHTRTHHTLTHHPFAPLSDLITLSS